MGPLQRMRGQARGTEAVGHRPWPLPERRWLMAQTWESLLFAHWAVPPEALRPVVPPQVPIDTFDGAAWLGVTPFVVRAFRLHRAPPPPLVSAFPELNVRTYATVAGKPGIYFFSLDAASALAVAAARRFYRLPYFRAAMRARSAGWVDYHSERRSGDGPPAGFDGRYRPTGPVFHARPGSLEHFLTERYCLYTLDEGRRLHRAEIHHLPWPLQGAAADIARNTMAAPLGVELGGEPLLHFSARQDVVMWPIRPVED